MIARERARTSLLVASLALFVAALGACRSNDQAAPVDTAAAPAPPPAEGVLYPPSRAALLDARGAAYLPADTFAVVAFADPSQLIEAADLSRALARGGHPYDETIAAVSLYAIGVELDSPDDVATAGLDTTGVWSVAWPRSSTIERVVFGPLTDATKLRERLAGKKKRPLSEKKIGDAVVLSGKKGGERAVVIRDGLVFFVQVDEAELRRERLVDQARLTGPERTAAEEAERKNPRQPALDLAERIAGTAQGSGLAASTAFAKSAEALAFGRHAAAFVSTRTVVTERLAELRLRQKLLAEHLLDDSEGFASVTERRAQEAQLATRIGALEQLATRVDGAAIGMEIGTTAFRLKAYATVAEGRELAESIALPSFPAAPRAALAGSFEAGLRDELLELWDDARVLAALHQAGLGLDGELAPLLRGEIFVNAPATPPGQEEKQALDVSLRVRDLATVRSLLERAASRAGDYDDKSSALTMSAFGRDYRISLMNDWLRIEAHGAKSTAVAQAPWPASDVEPQVAALAKMGDGALFAFDAHWLDGRDRSRSTVSPFAPPPPQDFGSLLGSTDPFGTGSFGRGTMEVDEKKREKLEKKRDELRDSIASLAQRQRLAEETGSERLLTALGTTVFVARPTPGGITLFGVQRFAEKDASALVEQALWALVDSSPVSETARELADKKKQLGDVEEKLTGMRSTSFNAELEQMQMSVLGQLGASSSMEGVLGGMEPPPDLTGFGGLAGGAVGGSGEGIGLGGIGSIGHGSGEPSSGEVRQGGGLLVPGTAKSADPLSEKP